MGEGDFPEKQGEFGSPDMDPANNFAGYFSRRL